MESFDRPFHLKRDALSGDPPLLEVHALCSIKQDLRLDQNFRVYLGIPGSMLLQPLNLNNLIASAEDRKFTFSLSCDEKIFAIKVKLISIKLEFS